MIVDERTRTGCPISISGAGVASGDMGGVGVIKGDCSGVALAVGVTVGGSTVGVGDGGTQAASRIAQMMSHLINVYPS